MTTRRARILAAVGVACSGGAQVAAGMVGSLAWQWVFLVTTIVTMAAGTWAGTPDLEKSAILNSGHWLLSKIGAEGGT